MSIVLVVSTAHIFNIILLTSHSSALHGTLKIINCRESVKLGLQLYRMQFQEASKKSKCIQ